MSLLLTYGSTLSIGSGEPFLRSWNNAEHTIAFLLEALLPAYRSGPSLLQLRQWTDSRTTSMAPIAHQWTMFVRPRRLLSDKTMLQEVEMALANAIASSHFPPSWTHSDSLPSKVAWLGRGVADEYNRRSANDEISLFMDSMVYWRVLDARCDPAEVEADRPTWEAIAGAIVGLNDADNRCARLTTAIREIVDPSNRDRIPVFRPWRGGKP
jgi:hypothetical protein